MNIPGYAALQRPVRRRWIGILTRAAGSNDRQHTAPRATSLPVVGARWIWDDLAIEALQLLGPSAGCEPDSGDGQVGLKCGEGDVLVG